MNSLVNYYVPLNNPRGCGIVVRPWGLSPKVTSSIPLLGPISWAKHCWLGGWTSRMPNQLLGVGLMLPRCASPDLIKACLGRSGQASRL